MANNTRLNQNSTVGDDIATLDVGGVKHEQVIVEYLVGGVPQMVDAANPLPVTDAVAEAALASIAAEDFATQATLADILAKIIAAPATEAKQDTQITAEQAIQTAVQIMDDWDESDRAKVNVIVGQAGIAAGTGVDGVTVPRVSLATNVGLPAGANLLGKTGIDQTTPGTTNLVALSAETSKVIGTVNVSVPTTIFNGKTSVTTAGTRVVLAASQAVKSVTIKALAANTGLIFVGNATVASTNGFQLSPGDSVSMDVADLNSVNIDSAVNAEGVSYIGIN